MKQSKKNSKKIKDTTTSERAVRIILIVILVIAIGITLSVITYVLYQNNLYQKNILSSVYMDATVDITPSAIGLNADQDALKYGKLTPGGRGTRFIKINSTEDAIVKLYVTGELREYLSVERNDFPVYKGIMTEVPVKLNVPSDISLGNHTGRVYIVLTRIPTN